jgi:16S rRNA (guanine966-N2)-methyltransferase
VRIIAGELRGRRIDAPEGEGTRPMLDRVREAVFSTLGDRVEGADVLDLFAGSGALGLECASRGARHVRCVERARAALDALKQNVETLGLRERVRVVRGDALQPKSWQERDDPPVRYALAFLDPPYPMVTDPLERARVLTAVRRLFETTLGPDGEAVLHVPASAGETIRFGHGLVTEVRAYGTSAIVYVRRDPTAPA